MNNLSQCLVLLFLNVFLAGCVVTDNKQENILEPIAINSQLYSEDGLSVISPKDVFRLSEEQQTEFLNYFRNQKKLGVKANRILSNFLDTRVNDFTYYGKTYVAQQSMALKKGNCMSLAILTTALAKLVDLKIDYRQVNSLPIFEKHNNIILSAAHVQSVVYDPDFVKEKDEIYFIEPAVIIDYFPNSSNHVSTKILKSNLIAQYYRNIAADALIENNLDRAFGYANISYQYDQTSSAMLNLLAVLHRRANDYQTAEKFYKRAIDLGNTDLELLSNYAVLLKNIGRDEELINVQKKIDNLYDPNPYSWLEQAYIAQRSNHLRSAEKYYLKVIELAPYVQQAYLGLYQIYSYKEQKYKAKNILKEGLKWTYSVKEKGRFKKKLYSLNLN